jgi:hypothetical protein
VLNGPDLPDTVASPVPIATMAKERKHALYVFAAAMRNEPSIVRLTIRGVRNTEAAVLDEGRKVANRDGDRESPILHAELSAAKGLSA